VYLKSLHSKEPVFGRTKSLFTIHNLAYQGVFPSESLALTGLGREFFTPEGLEFYGSINFLKAGIVGADAITTVSRTYAREILTRELGCGLDGLLRKRADRLHGVLNGVDYHEWDPATDRCLPAGYSADDMAGKKVCKKDLIGKAGLKANVAAPLISFVGRLAHQKGIELIAQAIPELVQQGARFVIVGKGDEALQDLVHSLGERFPGAVYAGVGFDEPLARLAYAGSDMFLMPSQYEPCGLGQMIAMRYGAVPIGRRTGGLADTIADAGTEPEKLFCRRFSGDSVVTGFLFDDYSLPSFGHEVKRALCCYDHQDIWRKVVLNGMTRDFSWARSARQYEALYAELVGT
jgi:starch synthase